MFQAPFVTRGRRPATRGRRPGATLAYWMPASLHAARTCPVQISLGFQNPSLMMVSLMLSSVTATGVEQDRSGPASVPLSILPLTRPLRRVLALGERRGQLRRRLGLGLDRLVDGHVLLAGEDPLDCRQLGVLTRCRDALRVDAVALHGGDGATGGAVVGGVDADEAVLAERRDRLLHLLLRLVRAPVRRVVLLGHLVLARVDDAVRALLEQLGVVVGWRAVDHHEIPAGAVILQLLRRGCRPAACRPSRCRTRCSSRCRRR